MTYSFNLVDQKWIPGIHFDGRVEELSLSEVLNQAHILRGIQGDSPLETAALYRLLLAVLHSALRGPRTKSDWADLWVKTQWGPELINGYLDKWRDRFDLFHPEKPFYQAKQIENAREKTINDIRPDIASANNATLFSHHTDSTIISDTASKSARTLIVLQTMSIAGGWGMAPKESSDAPWGRGIIFLVEGDDLFKTLALNLLGYPDERRNSIAFSRADRPAWEKDDPYQPVRQIPEGYLDYLTWQSRRVLLIPEGDENAPQVRLMTMAPGLRLDASILDPMKLYRAGKKEEGYYSTRFTEDRALWRDSASLFGLKSVRGNLPPKAFYWLADLVEEGAIPKEQKHRFMALGMANDQAKVEFFREEHFPLPLEYLEQEELVEGLAAALDLAEKVRFALKAAGQRLALLVVSPKSDGKKWQEIDRISKDQAEKLMTHWSTERFYWQHLGIPFQRLLEDLPEHPEALDTWKEIVRRAAWDALEQSADFAGTDAVALKAAVRARASLGYSLKELFDSLPDKCW